MQDLNVTLIQTELAWENIDANLAMFGEKIDGINEKTHLIVLPEMFSTGFSMNASNLAETMSGDSVNWIVGKSRQKNMDIVGSAIIEESGKYFNRLLWAKPDGKLFIYDKRHLFRMAGEDKIYKAGDKNITIELNGWKIRPFICYDLRFPAWTRNLQQQYDVAIFIANWPEKRAAHWNALLIARAIENQAYVIGVNRVGKDGNGYPHSGDSCVIDPLGNILFQQSHEPCIHTAMLSYSVLRDYRESFPAWMDADAIKTRDTESGVLYK